MIYWQQILSLFLALSIASPACVCAFSGSDGDLASLAHCCASEKNRDDSGQKPVDSEKNHGESCPCFQSPAKQSESTLAIVHTGQEMTPPSLNYVTTSLFHGLGSRHFALFRPNPPPPESSFRILYQVFRL